MFTYDKMMSSLCLGGSIVWHSHQQKVAAEKLRDIPGGSDAFDLSSFLGSANIPTDRFGQHCQVLELIHWRGAGLVM